MKRNLTKMALISAVVLGLALWASKTREPTNVMGAETAALPGLKTALNDITELHLIGAEAKPIATLRRQEKGWVLVERDGYPADAGKVRELLLKLSEAQFVEAKTSDPALYAKLGVDDISAKTATGVELEIVGPKTPIAKLIVGRFNGQSGDGTFMRRAGEAQSWLAKGSYTIDKTAAEWLSHELTDIASDRIVALSIKSGDKHLQASKDTPNQANFKVADIPKGRELSSEFAANGLASVLSGLRFDDVVKADKAEPGDARVFDVSYTTHEGLIVSGSVWEKDGKNYARLSANVDDARAAAKIDADQAAAKAKYEADLAAWTAQNASKGQDAGKPADPKAADGKPADGKAPAAAAPADAAAKPAAPVAPAAVQDAAKDRADRLAKVKQEADDLNARFNGWVFVIPAYKFGNMNKGVDDLLKPLESAKSANAKNAPAAPPVPGLPEALQPKH